MTLLAVLLAVGAVLLAVPAPSAAALDRRLPGPRPDPPPARRSSWWLPVAVVGAAVVVGALGSRLGGGRGLSFAAAGTLVVGTAVLLGWRHRQQSAAAHTRAAVAEAAAVLAANLRVGMVPVQALTAAASTCEVLAEARATAAMGGEVSAVWRRQGAGEGCGGLLALARAWQVAQVSGASLTSTLEQVAVGLAADQTLAGVVRSELAAPRATGKLMAVLPALGIGMGYLIGGDPLRWLASGPAGWLCLLLGVALACAGVLWIESLARRATAQT